MGKKHFLAERKNGRFSVVPAGTRSVVILGHFFMAWTVPPSFVENGPKLRVLIPLKWEWPKTAKNRGLPRKMTPSLETEIFWGGPNGKVVALDILVICPVDKICDYHTFRPKYPNFWVKKVHFCSKKPIGASPINVFNTKKVSHWTPDMRVPKVLLPPPQKTEFWPKNGLI